MFIKILLRNALGCALVLTTLNNCQAMDCKDTNNTDINIDIPTLSSEYYLELAEHDILEFDDLLDNNAGPEDSIDVLTDSNVQLRKVKQNMEKWKRNAVNEVRWGDTSISYYNYYNGIIFLGIQFDCFNKLQTVKSNLQSFYKFESDPKQHQQRQQMVSDKIKVVERAIILCKSLMTNLFCYRNLIGQGK